MPCILLCAILGWIQGVLQFYITSCTLPSKVADFIIFNISSTKQGGYYEYKPMYVSQIPIRKIDPSSSDDKSHHDKVVTLVERMLALNKQFAEVRTDHEKTLIKRQIEVLDREIDKIIYNLYELSEAEIKIVEGM